MAASFSSLPPEIGYEYLENIPVDEAYNIVRSNRILAERYPGYLAEVERLMERAKTVSEVPPGSLEEKINIHNLNEYKLYREQYIQDYIEKTPSHIVARSLATLLELCVDELEDDWLYLHNNEDEERESIPFKLLADRSARFANQNFWKGLTLKELRQIEPKRRTRRSRETTTPPQPAPPIRIPPYIPPPAVQVPTTPTGLPPPIPSRGPAATVALTRVPPTSRQARPNPSRTQPAPSRTQPTPTRTQPAPTRTQPTPTRGAGATARPPAPTQRPNY